MKNNDIYPDKKGLYGIFNDSFPPILDGVTLAVQNYVYWLSEKGRTPCVVTPWNPEKIEHPYSVMRYFSLPIYSRKPYRYGYPKLDPFIWRKLRGTDFKILHAHCPFSSGRLAVYVKKKQNIPLIGTFHSKYRSDLEHSFRRMPWCVPIIMKRILDFFNACDEVWIPQAQVEDTVREYGYKGRLTVVENGNDFSGIISGPLEDYKRAAKRRRGMEDDTFSLLFVGQHIWEKGIHTILESAALLKDRIKFHLDFIGTGYAEGEMRDMIARMGLQDAVTMHGVSLTATHSVSIMRQAISFCFHLCMTMHPLWLGRRLLWALRQCFLKDRQPRRLSETERMVFWFRLVPSRSHHWSSVSHLTVVCSEKCRREHVPLL